MNERPLLSCIIPAYNSSATIERAVYSLIDQGLGDNLQIVIADDDSPMPFFHLVQNDFYKFKHNIYARIPPHEPHSPGFTQRYAMRFVRGQYVMNLDHDDYIVEDSLRRILSKLEEANENHKICLVVTNPFYEFLDGTRIEQEQTITWTHGKIYDMDFITDNNIHFESWRMYQDLQFNMHYRIHMICQRKMKLTLNDNYYIWTDEPTSITHQNIENHSKNYAEYMYRANKSALNMYMHRYYYQQTADEREWFMRFFVDTLDSLHRLYDTAFRAQRIYFVKRYAEDIINAFDITQQRLLNELKNEEIGKIIIDERKIWVCTD